MNAADILKVNKINRTISREKVLNIMLTNGPLTQNEIGKLSGFLLNRITIYRCLRFFIRKGIVNRLQDNDGIPKFFLNNEKRSDHVHFKCSLCDTLYTFSTIKIRHISLPEGYFAKEKELFIIGTCTNCNKA